MPSPSASTNPHWWGLGHGHSVRIKSCTSSGRSSVSKRYSFRRVISFSLTDFQLWWATCTFFFFVFYWFSEFLGFCVVAFLRCCFLAFLSFCVFVSLRFCLFLRFVCILCVVSVRFLFRFLCFLIRYVLLLLLTRRFLAPVLGLVFCSCLSVTDVLLNNIVLVSVCVHILVFHFQKTFTGHHRQLWFQYIRFCFLLFFVAFWQKKSDFAKRIIPQHDLSCYLLQHRK